MTPKNLKTAHSVNVQKWQRSQNAEGLCATHVGEPLAITSDTVCQLCLDRRRDKAGSKPTRTIWGKILAGDHCRLSKRDIMTLSLVMGRAGIDIESPPEWATVYDTSTRTPKRDPA